MLDSTGVNGGMMHMGGLTRKALDEEAQRAAATLLAALEPFRAIRSTMPLQYVTAFLLVAQDEGKSVTEYAKQAGVSVSVMSRHLLDIGERNRWMEEGFGLISKTPDPMNLREHLVTLTPKGRALAHQILRQWKRA